LAHLECARTGGRYAADEVPEGAACFAAVAQLRADGRLTGADQVVVLNTGTGMKYPDTVPVNVPVLAKDGRILNDGGSA
jgi:threonine synthase